MKPQHLQQLLATQAIVITGLHSEYSKLLIARAAYNKEADQWLEEAKSADEEKAAELMSQVAAWQKNAKILTKFILKYKAKLKGMGEIQRALKSELRNASAIAAWVAEDDAFWLEEAKLAKEEGYAAPCAEWFVCSGGPDADGDIVWGDVKKLGEE